MTRYIIRRLIYVVLVVLAVTLVAYAIFFLLPSTDPAVAFAGRNPSPELIAEVEQQLGLDKPVQPSTSHIADEIEGKDPARHGGGDPHLAGSRVHRVS